MKDSKSVLQDVEQLVRYKIIRGGRFSTNVWGWGQIGLLNDALAKTDIFGKIMLKNGIFFLLKNLLQAFSKGITRVWVSSIKAKDCGLLIPQKVTYQCSIAQHGGWEVKTFSQFLVLIKLNNLNKSLEKLISNILNILYNFVFNWIASCALPNALLFLFMSLSILKLYTSMEPSTSC